MDVLILCAIAGGLVVLAVWLACDDDRPLIVLNDNRWDW